MAPDPADQPDKPPSQSVLPPYAEPEDLGLAGHALWGRITASFELREDELRVLEDACREADLIESLRRDLKGQSMLTAGSMGQAVINPLVQEIRQHRAILARLLGYVKLPDEDDNAGERSAAAREAASARWSHGS